MLVCFTIIYRNQQTNSDPKSSFEYNQTGPQNNQAFESEEYQQVDSVSLDSIEDNGSKQWTTDKQRLRKSWNRTKIGDGKQLHNIFFTTNILFRSALTCVTRLGEL